jgi:hypothetical protein
MSRPIAGTLAEVYLRRRGVDPSIADTRALRFHPRCHYREADDAPTRTYPALIAAVTDASGALTGAHRTWLDPASPGDKAPVSSPRRALGALLGAGVRFGAPSDAGPSVLAAGEGLETIISLRMAMPDLPMIAALLANHLAALTLHARLGRLYVAVDPDRADRGGMERLSQEAGIEVFALNPHLGDFNEDLRRLGLHALLRNLHGQLVLWDAARFLGAA